MRVQARYGCHQFIFTIIVYTVPEKSVGGPVVDKEQRFNIFIDFLSYRMLSHILYISHYHY